MSMTQPTGMLAQAGILPGIDERSLLVGKTRFGKSTLALVSLNELLDSYPNMELLVVDTKPHFKASHQLNGLRADILYRNWTKGDYFPNSLLLPAGDKSTHLDYAFDIAHTISGKQRGAAIILQTDKKLDYFQIGKRIEEQYRRSNKKRKVYIYIDESYSLLKFNRTVAEQVTLCVTAGGERGVGVMLSSQRPRWIPVDALSECTKFYVFRLDNLQDRKNVKDNGLPPGFRFPRKRFVFKFYDTLTDEQRLMRLNL